MQSPHAHCGVLAVDQLALALMLLSCAVGEGFFQQKQVAAEFELRENQTAQCFQRFFLIGRQLARSAINDTKRAEGVTIFVYKGCASVEADVRVRDNKGIVAEAIVLERIGDNEDIGLQDGCGAKSDVA